MAYACSFDRPSVAQRRATSPRTGRIISRDRRSTCRRICKNAVLHGGYLKQTGGLPSRRPRHDPDLQPRRPPPPRRRLDRRAAARLHRPAREFGERPPGVPPSRGRDVDLQRLRAPPPQDGGVVRPRVGRGDRRGDVGAPRRGDRARPRRPGRGRVAWRQGRRPARRLQRPPPDVRHPEPRAARQPSLLVGDVARSQGQRRHGLRRVGRRPRGGACAAGPRRRRLGTDEGRTRPRKTGALV